MEAFEKFQQLIKDQLEYGAKKYAHSNEREYTDVLVDRHSFRWLNGTLDKYVGRFTNVMRERDPLKIATYCYIYWLKRGFHLNTEGVQEVIDTNIAVKSENFSKFYNNLVQYYQSEKFYFDKYDPKSALTYISELFTNMSANEWVDINEAQIFTIYCLCFSIWKQKFFDKGLSGQDTDTNNEVKVLKEKITTFSKTFFNPNEAEDHAPILDEEEIELLSNSLAEYLVKENTNGSQN